MNRPGHLEASDRIHCARRSERGVASILIVAVLGLLGTLALMSWASAALAEQRSAMTQTRMLQVRFAAESGIAWALTRFNETGVHDAQCRLQAAAATGIANSATSLRSKIPWASAPASASVAPGGVASAHWACFAEPLAPGGWRCSCPAAVDQPWDADWLAQARRTGIQASRAAFVVSLFAPAQATGAPRLVSRGCADGAASCVPANPADASGSLAAEGAEPEMPAGHAMVSIALSQRTAMRRLPGAALIAAAGVHAGVGVTMANPGAATGGRVIWSGGAVDVAAAQVRGLPGAPSSDGIAAADPTLAALSADAMGRAWLGLASSTWGLHPTVQRVDCMQSAGACAAQVSAAIEAGAALIHVKGDLRWQPSAAVSLSSRPVMLVVEGALTVAGPADLRLVAMARDLEIDGRAGPVQWRGAAIATGRAALVGHVFLGRDAHLLDSLAREPLAIQAQAGSWYEP